jgi:hypothetical protein
LQNACLVEGCTRKYYAKGWCEMHYQRVAKYGDPHAGRTHAPLEERFWRYVEKLGPNDCWPWKAKRSPNGYGQIQRGGKGSPQVGAHRLSFLIANGFEPEVVMHTCDNPPCVNPSHLMAGTFKENMADMHRKGRARPGRRLGVDHQRAKLTEDDVRAIRAREGSGQSAASIGREYGVSHRAITAIWRRENWRHIP